MPCARPCRNRHANSEAEYAGQPGVPGAEKAHSDGLFGASDRLREIEVAELLNMGRTPVREALRRLGRRRKRPPSHEPTPRPGGDLAWTSNRSPETVCHAGTAGRQSASPRSRARARAAGPGATAGAHSQREREQEQGGRPRPGYPGLPSVDLWHRPQQVPDPRPAVTDRFHLPAGAQARWKCRGGQR